MSGPWTRPQRVYGVGSHGTSRADGLSLHLVPWARVSQARTTWEWDNVPREPVAQAGLCRSNHRRSVPVATARSLELPGPTTGPHRSKRSGSSSQVHLTCLIHTKLPRVTSEPYPGSNPGPNGTYSNTIRRDSQTAFPKRCSGWGNRSTSDRAKGAKPCLCSNPTSGHDERRRYD